MTNKKTVRVRKPIKALQAWLKSQAYEDKVAAARILCPGRLGRATDDGCLCQLRHIGTGEHLATKHFLKMIESVSGGAVLKKHFRCRKDATTERACRVG